MPHFSRLLREVGTLPPPQGKTERALGSCLSRCFIPGTTAEIFPPDPKHRGSTLSESATASLARPLHCPCGDSRPRLSSEGEAERPAIPKAESPKPGQSPRGPHPTQLAPNFPSIYTSTLTHAHALAPPHSPRCRIILPGSPDSRIPARRSPHQSSRCPSNSRPTLRRRSVAHPRNRAPHRPRMAEHPRARLRLLDPRRSLHYANAIQSKLPSPEPALASARLHPRARHRHLVDHLRPHPAHRLEHLHVHRPGRSLSPRPRYHPLARMARPLHHRDIVCAGRSCLDENRNQAGSLHRLHPPVRGCRRRLHHSDRRSLPPAAPRRSPHPGMGRESVASRRRRTDRRFSLPGSSKHLGMVGRSHLPSPGYRRDCSRLRPVPPRWLGHPSSPGLSRWRGPGLCLARIHPNPRSRRRPQPSHGSYRQHNIRRRSASPSHHRRPPHRVTSYTRHHHLSQAECGETRREKRDARRDVIPTMRMKRHERGWAPSKPHAARAIPRQQDCQHHTRLHTIPLRNSSSRYFVPRHTIPSFHSVSANDRSSV